MPRLTFSFAAKYFSQNIRRVHRAVDAEGEVIDVLVQSQRNKRAALKLMRKLLKKYAYAPERFSRASRSSLPSRSLRRLSVWISGDI
jgi:transposase-like protein